MEILYVIFVKYIKSKILKILKYFYCLKFKNSLQKTKQPNAGWGESLKTISKFSQNLKLSQTFKLISIKVKFRFRFEHLVMFDGWKDVSKFTVLSRAVNGPVS